MAEHARLFGASSFERLMLCPGSAVLAAGAPRLASQYSAEGTAIHEAAAKVLRGGQWPLPGYKVTADGFEFAWDADMESCGQAYVDYVQHLNGDALWVEQRVGFGPSIGVADTEDGFGTADAIVAKGSELVVVDLKTGRGVEVEAEDNPQLILYALGALALVDGLAGDFDRVRLVVAQPRAGGVKEWVVGKAHLFQWAGSFGVDTVTQVGRALVSDDAPAGEFADAFLSPGEKQCKFCPAKATCPALRDEVAGTVFWEHPASPDEFADIGRGGNADGSDTLSGPFTLQGDSPAWLAACLSKVDLIEDWCKAVRTEAERRLCEGQEVPGFKLVAGKRGARGWADEAQAEEVLRKQMRLPIEKAYNLKLITPPQAEKLAKAGDIGPRQWPKLQALITQSEGKPHVAPAADPRPAITVAATTNDFDLA